LLDDLNKRHPFKHWFKHLFNTALLWVPFGHPNNPPFVFMYGGASAPLQETPPA
jgi:hypothetical protein